MFPQHRSIESSDKKSPIARLGRWLLINKLGDTPGRIILVIISVIYTVAIIKYGILAAVAPPVLIIAAGIVYCLIAF